MQDNSSSVHGNTGFIGLLTVLLVGLKLTHYINWPWIWVLAPLWIHLAVVLSVLASVVTALVLVKIFLRLDHAERRRAMEETYECARAEADGSGLPAHPPIAHRR